MGANKQLFETTGTLTNDEVPVDIRALAGALAQRHGDVSIAMESRGTHLYLACPDCLEREGDKELRGRHLAVNADMYLGTGKWASLRGTYDVERSSMCMKTEKPFRVEDLLAMPPLEQRGIKTSEAGKVTSSVNPDRLVDDGRGNMIPEGPGICLPITALPGNHHAVEYLEKRGYNRKSLWEMFRCSYCVRELEENREKKRFYRRMSGGFKDTQQGRIIFYADMYGVQKSWQARIIDKIEENLRHYYWHPYENQWALYRWRSSTAEPWKLANMFVDDFFEFKPSKYRTAAGSSRNSTLMCLDSARSWNEQQGRSYDKSLVFLCEGPLDAGKLQAPAIPLLGKFLSAAQAEILLKHFKHIRYIHDNDEAGRGAAEKAQRILGHKCDFQNILIPGALEGKDPGDMTYEEAEELTREHKESTE